MKRFTIAVVGGAGEDGAWLDTGFVPFVAERDDDGRPLRPDVLLVARGAKGWAEAATAHWPKVIILPSAAAALPAGEFADAYALHRWRPGDIALASRLQAPLPPPPWTAYREKGRLTRAAVGKAVADAVYRHLLADVFRDTAEWCGHTFSVVTVI